MYTKQMVMIEIERSQELIGDIWGNMQGVHDPKVHHNMYRYFESLKKRLLACAEITEKRRNGE